ncbi:MAG: RusA family crossover junction endodeoxyribonuclease [Dehalococcoidia bacterium]
MSVLFACTVPGKPVPQGRARVGRWSTYYPETSVAYRKVLADAFAAASPRRGIVEPVRVEVGVCGGRANSDLDNYAKMTLDALQDAGVLASDDVRTVQALVLAVRGGAPCLSVTIEAVEPVPATTKARTPRKLAAKKEAK